MINGLIINGADTILKRAKLDKNLTIKKEMALTRKMIGDLALK